MRVAARADSARAALACARRVAAAVVLAATGDKAFQTRELMAPWQEEYERPASIAQSEHEFLGLTWGLGLGISRSWTNSIDDAEIVGGVVRVRSNLQDQPRVVFEYHKFLWCNHGGTVGTHGCGPFVAAATSDQRVLSGVGIGLMYGVKARADESDGFSIGVGALLDGSVKSLGEGWQANAPPPSGETAVRFESRGRWATLFFVSRSF